MAAIKQNEQAGTLYDNVKFERVSGDLANDLRNAAPGSQPGPQQQDQYAPETERITTAILNGAEEVKNRVNDIVEKVTTTALEHIKARRHQLDELEKVVIASGAAAKITLEKHLLVASGLLETTTKMQGELETYRRQIEESLPGEGQR